VAAPPQPPQPHAPSIDLSDAQHKGALLVSQELQDPIPLDQPLHDSTLYSSTYLPARLISQLGSIIKLASKQPCTEPIDSFPQHTSDQAATTITPSFNSILSTLFAHNLSHDNDPMAPLSILQDHLDIFTLNSILDTHTKVVDATSIKGLDGITNDINPLAFSAAIANNPDSLTQTQMLSDCNALEFVKAQCPEINGLQDDDVFEFHHCSEINSLPPGTHILNAIWSYHCKRQPNGTMYKHKSCICIDGSQQCYSIDYWIFMHWLYNGAPSICSSSYPPCLAWHPVKLITYRHFHKQS